MEVTADFVQGVQFRISARGHEIMCDQPRENGGEDTGMTPPEFLLGSLASCAGFYAMQYLKSRSLSTDGLRVQVTAGKLAQPARLGDFVISVEIPDVEEKHRDGVLRAVHKCLIHNTLLQSPAIDIAVRTSADAVTAV